jgi:hypothetical protein
MMTPGKVKRSSGMVKAAGVTEFDGLPRSAGLDNLPEVNRATSKDFTAPLARQFQQWPPSHNAASCFPYRFRNISARRLNPTLYMGR